MIPPFSLHVCLNMLNKTVNCCCSFVYYHVFKCTTKVQITYRMTSFRIPWRADSCCIVDREGHTNPFDLFNKQSLLYDNFMHTPVRL